MLSANLHFDVVHFNGERFHEHGSVNEFDITLDIFYGDGLELLNAERVGEFLNRAEFLQHAIDQEEIPLSAECFEVRHHVASEIAVHRKLDRKSTRLNSSHVKISYAVFCL